MRQVKRIIIISLACWCLAACHRTVTTGPAFYLEVTDYAGTGCLSFPVSVGDEFVIEYFHSYSRFPVRETYRIGADRTIELHQIVQKAEQCSQIIYPEVKLRDDGWTEIHNIHRVTWDVSFISGSPDLGNHRLEIHGRTIRLADTFEGGSEIQMRVLNFDSCVTKVLQ